MLCGFTPRSISTVTKRHPGKLQNILFTSFLLPIQKVCQTNQNNRTQQLSALWTRGGQRKAGGSPSPGPNERGAGRGRKQSPEPPAPEPWL